MSAKSSSVPTVAAFGYKTRFPFLKEEYLLVEFFDGYCTIDEILKTQPQRTREVLLNVFNLFEKMLADGFVHLDAHPKNILMAAGGDLRLIDFECCANSVIDHDFSLGFLMGYLYQYWLCRYIKCSDYLEYCEQYLRTEQPALNREVFKPVFERFITRKVSRTTRYSILTCSKAQAEFKKDLVRNHSESTCVAESLQK